MTTPQRLCLGSCAFGRAIDAYGRPLDGGAELRGRNVALELRSPLPNERVPVVLPLWTGIRAIDGLLAIGRGARVGIFGAPGTGKTSLIESIVAGCLADAAVVALIGERGREAQLWIERRDRRTTVVCATSDRSPEERWRAARIAMAHADALRERGLHVLLVLDSLARVATALRELTVAAGESAGRGGYPPRVFGEMARLVEVAGVLERGSITLIATVLHDGDDRDPVSEAARALLDGHITLSSRLAEGGHFPAIDVLASASRTMNAVVEPPHLRAAAKIRSALGLLHRIDDARALGIEPNDPRAAKTIAAESRLRSFLRQGSIFSDVNITLGELAEIAASLPDDAGS